LQGDETVMVENTGGTEAAQVRDRVARRIGAAVGAWAAGMTLEQIRQAYDALVAAPLGVRPSPVAIGAMQAAWISAPHAVPVRAALYCHGGGYQIGSIQSHLNLMARLAAAGQARVLAFEYRRAPEHRYPCASDDALSAYRWLLDRHGAPAAILGDSAGAALAVATALQARDLGLALPSCLVLLSPWLDLTMRGASYSSRADRDVFSKPAQLRAMVRAYLGRGGDPLIPLGSPVEADLTGLPPMLLQAGDDDITLDDSALFVERARAQGCDAEMTVFPGMFHHFPMFDELPESAQAVAQAVSFIERHAGSAEISPGHPRP